MYNRILHKMREKVRLRQYIMTLHAEGEMEDDGLSIFDVESCILTGEVIERQKEIKTGEWKYVIKGRTLLGDSIMTVSKIGATDKLVFITVYRD
jgi:hypothetical protein